MRKDAGLVTQNECWVFTIHALEYRYRYLDVDALFIVHVLAAPISVCSTMW